MDDYFNILERKYHSCTSDFALLFLHVRKHQRVDKIVLPTLY